jgi:hypothetical protein
MVLSGPFAAENRHRTGLGVSASQGTPCAVRFTYLDIDRIAQGSLESGAFNGTRVTPRHCPSRSTAESRATRRRQAR